MEMKLTKSFILMFIFGLFCAFPINIFAANMTLSFDISFDSLALRVENLSKFNRVAPFKRGVVAIFLLANKTGYIFADKSWKFLSKNAASPNFRKALPMNNRNKPKLLSLTPLDLTSFRQCSPSDPKPIDFSRLYVKSLIKNPGGKADSFIPTSIHELIISDKRISELKEIPEQFVPNEVKKAFDKEIEKIAEEENSPEYGYW